MTDRQTHQRHSPVTTTKKQHHEPHRGAECAQKEFTPDNRNLPRAVRQTGHEDKGEAIPLVELRRFVYDRGERPITRGWFHLIAAWLSVVSGSVLVTFAFMTRSWSEALGVLIYALGLVGLFGVSAAYHRGPWKSLQTINWWRRADHSMIALFIAATYTPLCLIVLPDQWWILVVAWSGAVAAVVLNMVWINHPRWLDVAVYLILGWLIVPLIPELWRTAGPAVVWLLFAGGVVYSLGAFMYAFRWPGRNARVVGFHEVFHAATIVAAVVHLIAVWMVVA